MASHLFKKAACGLFPHFFSGIIDRGELGGDDLTDDIIVKPYYSYILRDPATSIFQRLLKYGRTKIIRNKDAVGPGIHTENLFGCLEGMGFAKIAYEHERRVIGQAIVCQGLLVALQAACIYISGEVGR